MSLVIRSTQGYGQQQGVKILTFGGSGAGKTTLLATAVAYNPLILSAEGGLLSLARYNMPFMEITTMQQLTEAYNWLASSYEAGQYGLIGIDSISEIAEVMIAKLKKEAKDPRNAYGQIIDDCLAMVRRFRDLQGRHVFITAKMEYVKPEGGAMAKYQPSLPGSKLGGMLPYLFDEVFFLGVSQPDAQGNTFRYLQTCQTFDKECKDRSGMLATYEAPDLNYVIQKMLGMVR